MHITRVGQLRAPFAAAEGRGVETRDHEGRCLSMRVKEQVQRRGTTIRRIWLPASVYGVESAVTAAQTADNPVSGSRIRECRI